MTSLLDCLTPGPVREFTLDIATIIAREKRLEAKRASSQPTKKSSRADRPSVAARTVRVKDAAKYLGISEWTLRRHVHNGDIAYLPGKIWRFLITDLDRFLEQSKETKEVL